MDRVTAPAAGFYRGQLRAGLIALVVTLLTRAGRERQPAVDARLLPVAAGRRLRRHPAGGRGDEPGAGARAVRRGGRDPPVRAAGHVMPGEPGLVICGTANINALREVPPGQGGFCVTFDPDHVTLHREKPAGSLAARPVAQRARP